MKGTKDEVKCIDPVAYLWDRSERLEALFKQVSEFCGYELPEGKTEVVETTMDKITGMNTTYKYYKEIMDFKEEYWPKIWQAIRYISNITCWGDTDMETFLLSCRLQTIEVDTTCICENKCKNCDENIITIPLEYFPCPKRPFVGGTITIVRQGDIDTIEITQEYLNNHFNYHKGEVYIDRTVFPDYFFTKNCGCVRKVTIVLQYNAGHEAIPDGLLPLICPIVAKIDEAKIGMSNCHQAMTQVAGLLKRKKVGNVEYEWSNTNTDSQKTQTMFTDIYNIASLDEVMALSRCYMVETATEIGDVV